MKKSDPTNPFKGLIIGGCEHEEDIIENEETLSVSIKVAKEVIARCKRDNAEQRRRKKKLFGSTKTLMEIAHGVIKNKSEMLAYLRKKGDAE